MTRADVPSVVTLHLAAFPNFFLSFLGPAFLRQLYRGILGDESGLAFVAQRGGRLTGFVAGVASQSGFYRRLIKRHLIGFALASILPVLRRPAIVPRLLRALKKPAESADATASASLMSIAVDPSEAGKGTGQALVREFCRALRDRNVNAVCLTTDRDANDRTNVFYQRLGFTLGRQFTTAEGRRMNEYVMDLRA